MRPPRLLATTKLAHTGLTDQIAPADHVLWQLRASTGTKEERGLIAASLLGKKLAVGAVCGSVDVRVGPAGNAGATLESAFETAWAITNTAQALGMRVSCVLSDATRLPWHRIGRLESLLSLWEILSDGRWFDHPHVHLCREYEENRRFQAKHCNPEEAPVNQLLPQYSRGQTPAVRGYCRTQRALERGGSIVIQGRRWSGRK